MTIPDPRPHHTTPELTCARLVEVVTDYLEGALDGASRRRIAAHLDDCEACRIHLAHLRATIAATGRLDVDAADPATIESLLSIFRAWARERRAGADGADPPPAGGR